MTWGVTAVVTAVASTAVQVYGGRKARKARQKAARVEARRRSNDSRRAQISNIDEFRVVSGSAANAGAQGGKGSLSGGSGFQGLQAGLTSQAGANINYENQLLTFAEATESHLDDANLAEWQANTFGAALSTASSVARYKKSIS